MEIYSEIKDRLEKYSNVETIDEPHGLSVTVENGFTVWIAANKEYYSVGFEGLEETFEDREDALNCFSWCLSEKCRQKIFFKGTKPYKWVAQSFENGVWVDYSTMGSLIIAFWKKDRVEYKLNELKRS